jgi:hypothetical protein
VYRSYLPRSWDYRDSGVETTATTGFLNSDMITNHAVCRVRCSLTAGLDIALMKSSRMIARGTQLERIGAGVIDDDRGTTQRPAAHAIPCGIFVVGKKPIHLIPRHRKMQEFIADPYKYTNIVSKSLNDADHKAEAFKRRDGDRTSSRLRKILPNNSDCGNRFTRQIEQILPENRLRPAHKGLSNIIFYCY